MRVGHLGNQHQAIIAQEKFDFVSNTVFGPGRRFSLFRYFAQAFGSGSTHFQSNRARAGSVYSKRTASVLDSVGGPSKETGSRALLASALTCLHRRGSPQVPLHNEQHCVLCECKSRRPGRSSQERLLVGLHSPEESNNSDSYFWFTGAHALFFPQAQRGPYLSVFTGSVRTGPYLWNLVARTRTMKTVLSSMGLSSACGHNKPLLPELAG